MRACWMGKRGLRSAGAEPRRCRAAVVLIFLFSLIVPARIASQSPPQLNPEIRIIVVDSRSEAEQILGRLRAGEDFATLAREKSIDPSSANGGSLGRLDPTA